MFKIILNSKDMKEVEVFNNATGRWEKYLIGSKLEWNKPIKINKPKRRKRRVNRKKVVRIPRYVNEVVLEFDRGRDIREFYNDCERSYIVRPELNYIY